MSIAGLLNLTVSTQRPVVTKGRYGEQVESWAASLTDIRCRLQRKSAAETIFSDREAVFSNFTMYTEPGHDIKATDRVINGTKKYDVQGVNDANEMGHHLKIDLLEIV